ncbi:MFS transporter [Alicyclobacillus dauci]|uniref:MFS transporter n=1 Tax=Alicyclobacillus dauci TaxID=1475485 RepID=A0ABY6YZL7_9BACL|nr:MFS transporter [Alicyclobacillus dauci]WAH35758.1 MFS transporter [Alicyclobacillus dauci]
MAKHGYRLPPMAWWLLVVSGFFHLSISLSNTFINIFVFKVDHSFAAIAWYNLLVFICLPFTFVLAGWMARMTSTAMSLRIGIALHAVFYAITLMVGERAAKMPALLGILMGFAAGFYWLAFDVLSVEYTDKGGHEPFFGIHGVVTSISSVIAPPIAGVLISREDAFLGGLTGYHIVFGISFALFLAATILSFRLRSAPMSRLHILRGFSKLKSSPWWRLMAASSIYGMREGVFMFLIGLLVFLATGSEMKLGEFLLLQGGLSFLAFFLAGRWSGKFRSRLFTSGAIGMAIAATLFLVPIRAPSIVIYGCISAASLPFFLVPLQGFVYDGMESMPDKDMPTSTHIIVRESFENLGRITGIVLFLVICRHQSPGNLGKLSWLSFALGLTQLGAWAVLRPVLNRIGGKRPGGRKHTNEGKLEKTSSGARKRLNPTS